MIQAAIDTDEIVITASLAPEEAEQTPASVTVIEAERVERLGEPLVPALLRLTPSIAVATSGPAGSLTEVRIRGAENNHTLLYIDGIRANDPATGNQPRFELLNADLASRIEVVRGPQSALWGSEAIGGVIAVNTATAGAAPLTASAEAGSFGFRRASAAGSIEGLALGIGWQRARGIDSFDGNGDRDGYRNLSARLSGRRALTSSIEVGASGFALTGRSEFDGYAGFVRGDTLDSSRNRLIAGRLWSSLGQPDSAWRGTLSTSLLNSSNRNFLAEDAINRTRGKRWTVNGQAEHRFVTGAVAHILIAAAEHEGESFTARDTLYFGATNQDRDRAHQAVTLEWRAEAGPLVGDVALRRDRFNRFPDATTLRASALTHLGGGFSLAASYGEGIAQPTFFDLYGFFPGSFTGNPALHYERSRGIEGSLRFRRSQFRAAFTAYRQRLKDEIVDLFDSATFTSTTANRDTDSKRSGIEAEVGWDLGQRLQLTANYAYLDATQPGEVGGSKVREARRPKHSGSVAADGAVGRFTYGASIAYTGRRRDVNFDIFPAEDVRFGSYWLAGARVAYDVARSVQLFARAANAFDANYQDAVGYRTEGRSIHAGIRIAARR